MDNFSLSAETTTSSGSSGNLANVVVAVRIRPLSSSEVAAGMKTCCQVIGDNVVAIRKNGDAMQYLKSQQLSINEYGYDVVFDESSTQHAVFEKTAKPYVSRLLDGQNVTVFAYGATGAGKTHTMLGNTRQDEAASRAEAGIIPNSVQELFVMIQKRSKNKSAATRAGESYQVYLSFLEVYNEQVFDLLDSSGKVLSVREDQERGIVVVAGITEQHVHSYDQVIDFILQGNKRRKTEATLANAVSSRSHAVLQLVVKHTYRQENGREATVESKLSLIDLAGSERASATNNRGVRLQEGASINKSLLALANCINALAENSSVTSTSNTQGGTAPKKLTNVKYRDSKLTHLLKSSLEGNCNLIMIANINPSDSTYEDSHNTLKYANRAKNIKVNPIANKEIVSKDNQNWIEREMKLIDENNKLKKIIVSLEDKVKELERFKSAVMQNGGMLPVDYLDIDIADPAIRNHYQINADRDSVSSNSFVTTNEEDMDSSMSSLSTVEVAAEHEEETASHHCAPPVVNLLSTINLQAIDEDKEEFFLPKHADHEPAIPIRTAASAMTSAAVNIANRKRRVSHVSTATPTTVVASSTVSSISASRVGVTTRRQSMSVAAPTPRENNFMAPTASSTSRVEKAKNPFDLLVSGKIEDSAARNPVATTSTVAVATNGRRPSSRQSLSAAITSSSAVNLISAAMDRMDKSSETVVPPNEKVLKKARKEVDSPGDTNAIVTSPIAPLHQSHETQEEEEQTIRLEEFESSMSWLTDGDHQQPEEHDDETNSKKRKSVSCTTTRRKSMAKVAAMLDCLAQEVTLDFDFASKFNHNAGATTSISTGASVASSVNTNFIGLKANNVTVEEKDRRVTRSHATPLAPVSENATKGSTVARRKSVSISHSGAGKCKEKTLMNNENAENIKMDKQALQLIDI